jgi:hypothetical protein
MNSQEKDKIEKIELIKSYLNDLDLNLKNIIDESIKEMKEISSKAEKKDIDKILNDLKNI